MEKKLEENTMGEIFRDWKLIKKQKRKENLNKSIQILIKNKINFRSSDGVHFVVDDAYDFWPSTGLWINKKTKKKERGVFSLLKILKKQNLSV